MCHRHDSTYNRGTGCMHTTICRGNAVTARAVHYYNRIKHP